MRYLISCLYYRRPTGSELYVYDLSRELHKRGHEVFIMPQLAGNPLVGMTDGPQIVDYIPPHDILLAQHHMVSGPIIQATQSPVVFTCHSEVYSSELAFPHPRVYKYIAVREEIVEAITNLGIDESRIEVVPNGVDMEKFHPRPDIEPEYDFVPGTNDPVRKPMYDAIYRQLRKPTLFLGMGCKLMPQHPLVMTEESVLDIENYYARADRVLGLFKGRTCYEAWAMGKEFVAYDFNGELVDMKRPENFEDLYSLQAVVDRLEKIHMEAVAAA